MADAIFENGHVGADQVSSSVEVDVYRGQVLLRHDKLCRVSMFDPDTGRDIATMMGRAAYSIHTGEPFGEHLLVSLKDTVINRKRELLHNRLSYMIVPQMVEKKKTPRQIVEYIIDEVLKELS